MTGKNAYGPGANRAARRRQIETNGRNIVHDSRLFINIYSPADDGSPATDGQKYRLNKERNRVGLPAWNCKKAELGIKKSGIETLSKLEAFKLINALNEVESW